MGQSILTGRDLLLKRLGCRVGDETRINIWRDAWLLGPKYSVYGTPTVGMKEWTVKNYFGRVKGSGMLK